MQDLIMLRYSIILILVLIFACLQYRLWVEHNGVRATLGLKKTIYEEQQGNQEMLKRNQALVAEVKNLKEGKQAIEERARDELGMIQEGEQFYQITNESNSLKSP